MTFGAEFTEALEYAVENPIQRVPLDKWNPRGVACPERHVVHGLAAGFTTEDVLSALEQQNKMFEVMASMCRIYLNIRVLATTIDPVKEQVWLFAAYWLERYYELLSDPFVMRSDFYRSDNERFLALLRQMLQVAPTNRITFIEALRIWDPKHALLRSDESPLPAAAAAENPAKTDPPPLTRRLVLASRVRGGNNTRKNVRSSNHSLASDNHVMPVRD